MTPPGRTIRVVLFTGGRGTGVLSAELMKSARVELTLAINGYDDGLSTGEVRRFLGDSLGPSDFRKNASRLAAVLRSCDPALIELLDLRLPDDCDADRARELFRLLADPRGAGPAPAGRIVELAGQLDPGVRAALSSRLDSFEGERARSGRPFAFGDCSLGNLVFAGGFLQAGRSFNRAIDDYCGLLGLPAGMIENVTDGRNAYLVALDRTQRLLASEAAIVEAATPQELRDIYLLDRPPASDEVARLAGAGAGETSAFLEAHRAVPAANPRLLAKLEAADLVIYGPGTQHSSLFPSYLTPGIGAALARNLKAVKVLITNLQEDAEISGRSAVDLIDKALYYLREKGRLSIPTPCLITHYLLNDPAQSDGSTPYIPLGHLDMLEDPRLVRIGNYEEGISGRHDASKVLAPFVEAFLRRGESTRVALLLLDGTSLNKVGQTLVEMIRAGIEALPVDLTVYYQGTESFDTSFLAALPFPVQRLDGQAARILSDPGFEYVMLFESSGMYKGDDIVNLATHLGGSRLDAVWGSRRLSINDIRQAYKMVYRRRSLQAVTSYVGSHLLSLSYLLLYGRYISDTLSGVRVIRRTFLRGESFDYRQSDFNQRILSRLLRRRAELLEVPVYYFPISPEKVRRTTVADGLRSLLTILRGRWRALPPLDADGPGAAGSP